MQLCWHGFPLRSKPKHFCLEKLVAPYLIQNQSNCCLERQTGTYLVSLYSYLSYFQWTTTDFKCFHSLFQNLKFLISVAHFISSDLFQLYIFVLVYLETFPFAHFINSVLMEQIELQGNRFNVVLEYDENEMFRWFHEEEEQEQLLQKEYVEYLQFKISSPAAHRICGFDLFTESGFLTP